jgi:hypothetical protein
MAKKMTLNERAMKYAEKIPNPHVWEALADDESDGTLNYLLSRAFKAGWNARGRQAEVDFRDAVCPPIRSGIQM